MTEQQGVFVGIDASKGSLDVAVSSESRVDQFGNQRKGITDWLQRYAGETHV